MINNYSENNKLYPEDLNVFIRTNKDEIKSSKICLLSRLKNSYLQIYLLSFTLFTNLFMKYPQRLSLCQKTFSLVSISRLTLSSKLMDL